MRDLKLWEILALLLFCVVVFGMAFIGASDSVCDTPLGARDLRCVGHYR
jgi:hypothetical protein